MSISRLKGKNVDVHLWAPLEEVEPDALKQLSAISALPWVFHHVAAMADVHLGKGATVGSVIAMKDAVAPAAVGVDIGCGMAAVKTNLTASDLPESLSRLRLDIEAAVPVGFNAHDTPAPGVDRKPLWQRFSALTPEIQKHAERAMHQLGTLGGGNHFLEICLDTAENVWVMLHSGSRNIGKELAEIHIARAKKLAHNQELPDRDLAVFLAGTKEMAAYRHDLFWAQEYARENREVMLELAKAVLKRHFPKATFEPAISCHHNYVSEEHHFGEEVLVTRKGAIRAGRGDMGIIPGSMGTRSYIVRGLGNPESFESASHGAGRKMSRNAARKAFTVKDLADQTAGIECRKDDGVLDEIPGAYKPIEKVMENQRDLVEIVAEHRQILCVKG
jgi:tRNA-splicing ligase RtcB